MLPESARSYTTNRVSPFILLSSHIIWNPLEFIYSSDRKIKITVVTCVSTRKGYLWGNWSSSWRNVVLFCHVSSYRLQEKRQNWITSEWFSSSWFSGPPLDRSEKEETAWWEQMLTEGKKSSYHARCCKSFP